VITSRARPVRTRLRAEGAARPRPDPRKSWRRPATLEYTRCGRTSHREGAALGGRERGAQPPGPQPRRPARGARHRRRACPSLRRCSARDGRAFFIRTVRATSPSASATRRRRWARRRAPGPRHRGRAVGGSGRRARRRPQGAGREGRASKAPDKAPARADASPRRRNRRWVRRRIRSLPLGSTGRGRRGGFATRTTTEPAARGRQDPALHQEQLYHAGIAKIDIERIGENRARITIFTARPGHHHRAQGRRGGEAENELQARTGKEIYLNIEEVIHPELDAQLVSRTSPCSSEARGVPAPMKKAVTSPCAPAPTASDRPARSGWAQRNRAPRVGTATGACRCTPSAPTSTTASPPRTRRRGPSA